MTMTMQPCPPSPYKPEWYRSTRIDERTCQYVLIVTPTRSPIDQADPCRGIDAATGACLWRQSDLDRQSTIQYNAMDYISVTILLYASIALILLSKRH